MIQLGVEYISYNSFQAYMISVLCFSLTLGEYDENKRYSCYKCDSKTNSVDNMVGDCWTLDGGDYEITKEECHGCYVSNTEEINSNGKDLPSESYE